MLMAKTYCYFQFDCDKGKVNESNCMQCPAYYPIYGVDEVVAMSKAINICKVANIEDVRSRNK